jgi:UDP:flavonoid glycosyltransferase YjiC (YdhE family)
MSRRRIALFADGGFLAHTTRVLEVGRALARDHGHEVVFCCEGSYSRLLREAGFQVRPVYTVDREVTLKLVRRAGLCDLRWWRDVADRSVRSDMEALEEIRPDLVVGDLRMSLSTSARALGIPYVSVTNAAWTSRFAEEITVPEGHISEKLLGRRVARALFPLLKRLLIWYWARGFDRVRERLGLSPLATMYDLIEGDLTLLADLPEYFPILPSPPSFRYVGPIRFRAALPKPAWLSRLSRDRPTVYFTMGSSGEARFFGEAIRAFGGTEYQVLITTAGLPADLFARYDNVFVEDLADGDALMAASDVTITHGGNGTIYQALGQGVPVIGIATMFDQEINLQRVEALGVGMRLQRRHCKAARLRAAVDQILATPSYAQAAMRLKRRIDNLDGPRSAARHINHFVHSGDPCASPLEPGATAPLTNPMAPPISSPIDRRPEPWTTQAEGRGELDLALPEPVMRAM